LINTGSSGDHFIENLKCLSIKLKVVYIMHQEKREKKKEKKKERKKKRK
jgi:hypothetical protein